MVILYRTLAKSDSCLLRLSPWDASRCWMPAHVDDGPPCCKGFTMATLWHVPMRPLAALALLLSDVATPVFQATTLFQQWLITVLMKCEGSGNVTGMTRACQCGPAGSSVSHTDIWKGTKYQPLLSEPVSTNSNSFVMQLLAHSKSSKHLIVLVILMPTNTELFGFSRL